MATCPPECPVARRRAAWRHVEAFEADVRGLRVDSSEMTVLVRAAFHPSVERQLQVTQAYAAMVDEMTDSPVYLSLGIVARLQRWAASEVDLQVRGSGPDLVGYADRVCVVLQEVVSEIRLFFKVLIRRYDLRRIRPRIRRAVQRSQEMILVGNGAMTVPRLLRSQRFMEGDGFAMLNYPVGATAYDELGMPGLGVARVFVVRLSLLEDYLSDGGGFVRCFEEGGPFPLGVVRADGQLPAVR